MERNGLKGEEEYLCVHNSLDYSLHGYDEMDSKLLILGVFLVPSHACFSF